jgi:hypothetical protein
VICHRYSHVPFLCGQVDGNARAKDVAARLVLRRDLFKSQRRIVENSQLEISAASDEDGRIFQQVLEEKPVGQMIFE